MASLHRLTTSAFLAAVPRKVVSASFSHSAALSSTALSAQSFESPNVPEILDIFDAPAKLRERNILNEPLETLNSLSTARRAGCSHSKSIYNDALGSPWSLPPPVTFDGPACPPHMSSSTLHKLRLQRRNLTRSPRGGHGSSAASCSAFTSQSEPIYRLFDGPSRVIRYRYPTSRSEVSGGATPSSFRHSLITWFTSGTPSHTFP